MATRAAALAQMNRRVILAGGVALFVAGFFLLAGLPVVPGWPERHAGSERAGGAAGFRLLAGHLGGVALVLVIQAALGNRYPSLGAVCVACLAGLVLATRLPARGAVAAREGEPS